MQIKGLIHVHSDFSDGELSLEEIKEKSQKMGVSFVLMADHMERLGSQQKVDEMAERCKLLSDKNFLMIPGLEVSPKGSYHILIYNCREYIDNHPTFEDLIKINFSEDRFMVLAHASHYSEKLPQKLTEKLDGIEVWNAKYDSRYAPNLRSFKHLGEDGRLVAMAGLDAHGEAGLKKMLVKIEADGLEVKEILNALRKKRFRVDNGSVILDINQPLIFSQRAYFAAVNFFYAPIRIPFVFFAKMGIEFPPFLRKIFHKFF